MLPQNTNSPASSVPSSEKDEDISFMDNLAASADKAAKTAPKTEEQKKEDEPKTTPEGIAGAVARGIAPTTVGAGIGAIAGIPLRSPTAGAKIGAAAVPIGDVFVSSLNKIFKTHYIEPSDAITHMLDKAGVSEPRSQAEKIVFQLAKGGAEALGTAGGAGEAAKVISGPVAKGVAAALGQSPLEQAAVGAGLAGGAEAVKEAGGNAIAQLGIPTAGLAALGGIKALMPAGAKALAGIVPATIKAFEGNKEAQKALASAAAPSPVLSEAAKSLGLKNLPPEILSENPQYQGMVQAVKSVPGSQTGTRQLEALQGIGERAQQLITDLGGKTDLSQVSNDVRSHMMNTKKELEDAANTYYGVINESFDKQTPSPARQALEAVKERLKLLGGDENELSPIEKRIYKSLRPQQRGASSTIQQPSYELLDTIRKEVGDSINRSGPFKDEVSGNAKRYYALLSEDQAKVLDENKLGKIAEMARASVRTRKALEDQIANLYGSEVNKSLTPSLVDSIGALSRGNADRFVNLMNNLPPDMKEQVAVSGLSSAFGKATQNGSLNFNTYSKWYEGLKKNQAAYQALSSNLPKGAIEQMENLYLISKNVNNALSKDVRTGLISEAMKAPESMMSKVRGIAKKAAIGAAVGAPVAGVAHELGLHGLGIELGTALTAGVAASVGKNKGNTLQRADEFLMSPEFQKLVAASQADPMKFKQVASQVEKSPYFKRFADAAGIPVAQRAGFFANFAMQPQQPTEKNQNP